MCAALPAHCCRFCIGAGVITGALSFHLCTVLPPPCFLVAVETWFAQLHQFVGLLLGGFGKRETIVVGTGEQVSHDLDTVAVNLPALPGGGLGGSGQG